MPNVLTESSVPWQHDGVVDVLEQMETCEHCGKERVRFIHLLTHPDRQRLRVGYVCAAKLTGEDVARDREEIAKNRASRALRLMTHKNWCATAGGLTLRIWNANLAGHVRVARDGLWWSWQVELTGRVLQSTRPMVTPDEAKRDAIRRLLDIGDFRAD